MNPEGVESGMSNWADRDNGTKAERCDKDDLSPGRDELSSGAFSEIPIADSEPENRESRIPKKS